MSTPGDEEGEDAPTAQRLDGDRFPPADLSRLTPDSVLADRYRVVRFISEGGMGAVYEAEDLQLHDRVALKTVRPAIAGQAGALDRFKRETQLARRVTHPNVCRIFEFGIHRVPGLGEVAFLTMELLQGETLARRIRRGRLPVAEALPLAEQMAAGLAAAHQAGVIHRDFKSSNVMLTPAAAGGTRAVVSDFGLAQGPAAGEGPLEASDTPRGTLDYMAPEQVEGSPVTAAADLYAFGVVLYEMVTGVKPFTGSSALSAAVKRLREPPRAPRSLVPDLDPRWQAVILQCLARDPQARFASPLEAVKALRPETAPIRGRTQRLRTSAILVGLALATGAGYLLKRAPPPDVVPPVPSRPRRAVAVLGFKNLSQRAESSWLSTALSEMLTTELAAGGRLRMIPGENVGRMKMELSLSEAETLAADTLARVGKNLGTDMVLLGWYLQQPGGEIRLDLRLQDVTSGETLVTMAESGTEAGLVELVTRAGSHLRQSVGVGEPLPAEAAGGLKAATPANIEAQRHYAAGIARLRVLDALGAKDLLVKAVEADPGSPMAHSALSEAWAALGYDGKAKEEARKAFDLSGALSREERLSVEGRHRETAGEWDKAIEIHRALFAFFPDNLEYGLKLAQALTAAGKTDEVRETLASLRRLPPPASEDSRIDLAESAAAQSLGDFRNEREAARRAAASSNDRGARLLVARARLLEAYASGRLGLGTEAKSAADEARRIYLEAGDRGGLAWALNRTGNVLFQQGHLVESLGLYKEALGIFEGIGYGGGLASVTNNIALVQIEQGDLGAARKMIERARSASLDTGDRRGAAIAASNVAGLRLELGDLEGAKRAHEQALDLCRTLGEKSLEAGVSQRQADALAAGGDLAGAKAAYRDALTALRRLGNTRYVAVALFGLGQVLRDEGDQQGAHAAHEEALALRRQLGDRLGTAASQVALAGIALEERRPAGVESAAQEAAELFSSEQASDREAEARAVLASVLQLQGRPAEATEAASRASALATRSQRPWIGIGVSLALGRVKAAAGRPAEAKRELQTALAEAGRRGFRGLELEAGLALGEVEIKSGRMNEGREQLLKVEAEARGRGFGVVVRRAGEALAAVGPAR